MNFLLSVAVITSVASVGSGLQCYICNSHTNEHCETISAESKDHLKECPRQDGGKPEFTLCRKIDMYLDMNFGDKHPAGRRIHRGCGYMENDDPEQSCYYKSGYNTRSWVCACSDDECNAAVSFSNAQILTLLLPLALLLVPRNNY